jgi:hypothetical protein
MQVSQNFLHQYTSAHGLPPLAGIASFPEAASRGLSVEECVRRHKHHHWILRRVHEIGVKRLTAEPCYELKMAFSRMAHLCAERGRVLRTRVAEMREPPYGLDQPPSAALEIFCDELLASPDTASLVLGIYGVALPHLAKSLRTYQAETNRLADNPSWRVNRFALIEVDELVAYGAVVIEKLVTAPRRAQLATWQTLLDRLLAQSQQPEGDNVAPARHFSAKEYKYDGVPRRDERFPDPYNLGVHAEAFLYDEQMPVAPKMLMLFHKRLREIDVPEMMASILAETTGKSWDYTCDMTRQLWDEARHAMMGEVGFVQAGIDWRKWVRINHTWSLALNTQLKPLERHAVLYFIEQGLMPKTGKRFEWETALAAGEDFAATVQDFDWADEVLHARIGRDWYVKQIGESKRAIEYGDECWSRVLIDWQSYIDKGLTQHKNWWPELYREWCRLNGKTPEERVLAYATSYAAARPDLKEISLSA